MVVSSSHEKEKQVPGSIVHLPFRVVLSVSKFRYLFVELLGYSSLDVIMSSLSDYIPHPEETASSW